MRTRLRAEAYPGEEPDSLIDPISIGPLLAEIIGREDLGLPSEVVPLRTGRPRAPPPRLESLDGIVARLGERILPPFHRDPDRTPGRSKLSLSELTR